MTDLSLRPPARPAPGYGLEQVVRSELVKVTSLRSTLWTLAVAVTGTVGVSVLSTGTATHHSAAWYQGFDPTNQSLAGLILTVLTVGVFATLAITAEHGTGTIRSSLAATPRRPLLLAGKAVVVGGAALVVGEVLAFVSFAIGQVILAGGGAPSASLGQPGVLRAVALSGAFLSLLALFGLGLGAIVRNTAGAVSAFVGVTFLLPFLLQRLPNNLGRFTPLPILANSVAAVHPTANQLAPGIGFLLMAVYAAAALALGTAVLVRRDA